MAAAYFAKLTRLSGNRNPFEDSNGQPWYHSSEFERFWNVYSKYMFYAHQDALSRCYETRSSLASALYNLVKSPWPSNYSEYSSRNRIKRSRSKSHKKKRKQKKKKAAAAAAAAASTSAERGEETKESVFVLTDDDTLQVQLQEQMQLDDTKDIDDDFLAFMKQSVIHRIKWNKIKEEKKREDTSNLSDEGHASCSQEHPDIVREREMKILYGEHAPQIHGMETAMQLSFDRISTMHQPTIWPNIPLNLKFQ